VIDAITDEGEAKLYCLLHELTVAQQEYDDAEGAALAKAQILRMAIHNLLDFSGQVTVSGKRVIAVARVGGPRPRSRSS